MLRETRALIFATGTLHDRGHLLLRCRCVPGFLAGLVPRIGLHLEGMLAFHGTHNNSSREGVLIPEGLLRMYSAIV